MFRVVAVYISDNKCNCSEHGYCLLPTVILYSEIGFLTVFVNYSQ